MCWPARWMYTSGKFAKKIGDDYITTIKGVGYKFGG
ncbi:MAG: hypothetical protein KatS3mg032_2513 [Cyclobacteriaceae bacterium]|nr:MAG: hypothetical protein KatS3mg032_2513 [Cyclobacteriaceae bacterium]